MGQLQQCPGTVLVVEDDAVSHLLVAHSLQRRGFAVVHAKDAANAIKVLESGVAVDVVFSDVIMPGEMNGLALQEWIRIHRPTLPVILGSVDAANTKPTSEWKFRFFAKPYNMNAVASCIRSLIR
jgi:DNA-binding NtrC family response regulator